MGYDGIAGVGNVGVVVDVGTECVCSGLVVVVEAVVTSGAWSSVNTTDVIGSGSVGAGSMLISVFLVSNVGAWFELSEWYGSSRFSLGSVFTLSKPSV